MSDPIKRDADALAPDLVAWRRDLHRHPELGFEEHRTAAFVAERMRGMGLEVRTGIAGTGVAGILRAEGGRSAGVLLRADMDALPILEEGGREYGSTIPGRMHACGHDGHVAMLLGAASLLASRRARLARDVTFCFQPGEEGMGGAKRMIDAGVLEIAGAREAYAIHLWTPLRAGCVGVRPGPVMAAQDELAARIVGRGGHGALPHLAVDPIVAAAHAVTALQTIVSRSVDPVCPAVVTIGSFHAGSAPNVIPDDAVLQGTLRSFDEDVRATLRARVREVLEGAARAAGCRAEVDLRLGYPATVNDAAAAARVRREAEKVFDPASVIEPAPLAAAEDFSYFLREVPGAFVLLGAGNPEQGLDAPHHSPRFDIDESVLPRGAELLARIALASD